MLCSMLRLSCRKKVIWYISKLSALLEKRHNFSIFLFAFLDNEILNKDVYTFGEVLILSFKTCPFEKVGKNGNSRTGSF